MRRVAQPRGELARLRRELRVGVDAGGESEFERPARVNRVAEEEDLAGDVRRNHARDAERAAPVRVQSDFDERLAEGRGLRGEPYVAREREVEARAVRGAVDGRDDGLEHLPYRGQHAAARAEQALELFNVAVLHQFAHAPNV